MSPAAAPGRLRSLLEPVVRGVGLDLENVAVTPAGRRRLVRVVVDSDTGVSLDAVAEVSTAVSAALDGSDALGDNPYVLEVTSPGVDRPLREPRHWRRAVGRLVSVSARGAPPVTGRVVSATDGSVTLEVDGTPVDYPLAELGAGHVQVEFSRPGAAAADEVEAEDEADDEDALAAGPDPADELDDEDGPDPVDEHDDEEAEAR